MDFDELQLPKPLCTAVAALGYERPTPIQEQAIPLVLAGKDLAAQAETGSGKTAAFALPLLSRLVQRGPLNQSLRVLVMVPTRELALQVAAVFKALAKFLPQVPKVVAIIGGQSIDQQVAALDRGVSVVVATPGRLLDLVDNEFIDLSTVEHFVLDEADKLLDQGFVDELDALLSELNSAHQTLLFSATLPDKVLELSTQALHQPVVLRLQEHAAPVALISQRVFWVNKEQRRLALQHLMSTEKWGQTLIFVSTKRATENLARKLNQAGFSAVALHGGLEQSERIAALLSFKRERCSILVATDIAARGIDVPDLQMVVNFDLPRSAHGYVHRVGRTARAGKGGQAVSFVDYETAAHFRLIEKRNQLQVVRQEIPGFELTGAPPPMKKGPPPTKGRRKSKKDKLREKAALEQSKLQNAAQEAKDPPAPEELG